MKKKFYVLLLLIILSGCVSAPKRIVLDPDINETIVHFHKSVVAPDHKNHSLTELYRGKMFYRLGDCYHSDTRFAGALTVMSRIVSDEREGVAIAINENARTFRGEPHERAAAYLYRGICQFNHEKYEGALAAFRLSLESDKETRAKNQEHLEDFNISHFLTALTYERLGEPENAAAVLKLARQDEKESTQNENQLNNGKTTTENENGKNISNKSYLIMDNLKKNFVAIIETGYGPYLVQWPFWTKEFKSGWSPESRVEIIIDGNSIGAAIEATDLFEQANSQILGAADKAAIARGAGKFVINVFVSALAGRDAGIKENRDLRTWYGVNGLPRKYFIFIADIPPGLHTVGLKFYDVNGNHLERYEQVWHEVPVTQNNGKIFLARSMYNKHNIYGLELQSLKEIIDEKQKQLNAEKEK